MKKSIFKKIGGLFLGLAMIIGISAGISSVNSHETFAASGDTYSKVTDVGSLGSGDTIIIVCESKNDALSTTQNTNNRGVQAITINNGSTSFVSGVQDIVLSGSSGQWILTAGDIRLSGVSNNNHLKNGTDTWSISISSGNATITSATSGRVIKRNSSSNLYATYSSGQTAVQIYKKNGGATKTLSSIAISSDMSKKNYTTADDFDATGLIVTATYSDASTADVTASSSFSFDPLKPTKDLTSVTVTASYNGKTTSKTVTGLTVKQSSKQSTSISTFSATSGWVDTTTKKYVYYEAFQGDGTTAPVVNSSKLRLYKPASGKSTGGFITLTAYENAIITKVIFKSNRDSGNNYRLTTNGTLSSLAKSGSSAPYSYTISDLNTSLIQIVNTYGNSNDISYIEVEFELPPAKQLTGITIDSQPTNKNYSVGDTFDPTGMVVKAIYDDESSEEINDYSIVYQGGAAATSFAAADTQVTISYEGKTADVSGIDVSNYKGIEVTGITDVNRTFTAGDKFSFGGSVRKVYGHSSKADTYVTLTNEELNQCTFKLDGTTVTSDTVLTPSDNGKKVVITFNGNSTTDSTGSYNLIVNYAEPTGISGISSTYTVGVGDTLTLSPVLEPQGYVDSSIEFDYDDYEITSGDIVDEEDFLFVDGELVVNDGNTHSGEITVTVYPKGYTSLSQEIVITVLGEAAPVLQSIRYEITGSYKATQYTNKALDISGLTFYAVFDKGDEVDITNAIEWDDEYEAGDHPYGMYADPLDEGNIQDVEVTEITFENDYVASIQVTGNMTNKSYVVGQSWSAAGLGITGTNASGDPAGTITATRYEFDPSTTSVELTQVKVRGVYLNQNSAEIKSEYVTITGISVVAKSLTSIEVKSAPTTTSYTIGDEFDPTGLVVEGTYNDGSKADLTLNSDFTLSEPDMFTKSPTGGTIVTVLATGVASKTFTISVSPKSVGKIYNKISTVADITEGDYIISYSTYGFNALDKANGYTSVSISDNSIASTDDVDKLAIHITPVLNGQTVTGYTLKTASNNPNNAGKYLSYTSGSNTLAFADAAKEMSIQLVSEATFLSYEDGGAFVIGGTDNVLAFNATSGNLRYRFYKAATPLNTNGGTNYYAVDLYKAESSGEYDVVRLRAEHNITRTLYDGDVVAESDFDVYALLNDGNPETKLTSGFTLSGDTQVQEGAAGENVVTISYGGKTVDVQLPAVEAASRVVDTLSLVTGSYKNSYVVKQGATNEWDVNNISIHVTYSSGHDAEDITLADAIRLYGATLDPEVPTVGEDGFDISFEFLGVELEDNHVSAEVVAFGSTEITINFKQVNSKVAPRTDYWENEKFDLAATLTSIRVDYNDGTHVTDSIVKFAGAKLGLYEYSNANVGQNANVAIETIDDPSDFTMLPEYDGLYLGVEYDGLKTVPSTCKLRVCGLINDITYSDPNASSTWNLVKSVDDLIPGDEYLIVSKETSNVLAPYSSGNYYTYVSGTVADEKITPSTGFASLTLGGEEDAWTFFDGTYYICANSTSSNYMVGKTDTTTAIKWKVNVSNDGTATITNATNTSKGYMSWNNNSGQYRFSCYGSAQTKGGLALYHLSSSSVTYSNKYFEAQYAIQTWCKEFMGKFDEMCSNAAFDTSWEDVSSMWESVAASWNELFGSESELVNKAEALKMFELADAISYQSGDYLQGAMQRYEAFVAHYGLTGNNAFITDRDVSAGARLNPIANLSNVDNSVWVISAVALVGLTAIGGYFFYRKRKEI